MAIIERVTLFKIPNDDDRQRVLEQFKVLVKSATKVRLLVKITDAFRVLTMVFPNRYRMASPTLPTPPSAPRSMTLVPTATTCPSR